MTTDAVGGVWQYSIELARGLSALGIDVRLAVLGPKPTPCQCHEVSEIERVESLETGLPLDWTAHRETELDEVAVQLRASAHEFHADVVHLNAPAHAGLQPWAEPLVVAAHSCVATWWRVVHGGPMPADLAWRRGRTAAGLRLADAVIVPSRSFADQLTSEYGRGLPIRPVRNARSNTGCSVSTVIKSRIMMAGRLWDPAKNATTVYQAAEISGLTIHAAGPTHGPNGQSVRLPRLELMGVQDAEEMAAALAHTEIFVSVSNYEPFGLSVLEAAQAGAALVLSDIPTFRELWGGAAEFVPRNDPAALASALIQLRENADRRIDLAARAKARAAKYNVPTFIAGTMRVHRFARLAHARRNPSMAA